MSEDTQYKRSLVYHPYIIMLTLILIGVVMAFIALSASYIYSRVQNPSPPIKLPSLFYLTTLILLGSSGTMMWAKRCYQADDTQKYQMALLSTIILSVIFMIIQYFAWRQLFNSGILITHSTLTSHLYLICTLHFMHVLAGLPVLILFLRAAYLKMKEPVSVLVYFSDPEKRLKLRLLTIYWHFLDGLWIYLMLFFLLNWAFS